MGFWNYERPFFACKKHFNEFKEVSNVVLSKPLKYLEDQRMISKVLYQNLGGRI